jgi:hypothetical protein
MSNITYYVLLTTTTWIIIMPELISVLWHELYTLKYQGLYSKRNMVKITELRNHT